jgi:DHA3 family macrolide efflux protein-like MFS transporter
VEFPIATSGQRVFALIWLGQLVSLIGSNLSSFALGVWVYKGTGSATNFALLSFFIAFPGVITSPLAGALVDRWKRRTAMIISDSGAGLTTLAILLLLLAGSLKLSHIYLAVAAAAIFNAFRWLAYSSSVSVLLPKRHAGRASGLIQGGPALAQVISPALAGSLVMMVGITGVLLIDLVSFIFALVTILVVDIPTPVATAEGKAARSSLVHESAYGWFYLRSRPGLFGLLILLALTNSIIGVVTVLASPLVLTFASPAVLGFILSIGGSGMVISSIAVSTWGGPKNHVSGVLGFILLMGVCIVVAGLRPSELLFAVAVFFFFFALAIINSSSHAIWLCKVAADLQGRVFAVRSMLGWLSLSIAYLLAGPLADRIFEPLLAVGGPLAGTMERIIGVGPGRGIGLLFTILGVLTMLIAIGGWLFPRLRFVEDELPDMISDEVPA